MLLYKLGVYCLNIGKNRVCYRMYKLKLLIYFELVMQNCYDCF